ARQLVAAARAAEASQNSFALQTLEHGFQVSRRQSMARGERFGRNRTSGRLHSHIDDRCNREECFAWEQWHVLEKSRCGGSVRWELSKYIRHGCFVNRQLAAGLFSFRFQSGGTEAARGA